MDMRGASHARDRMVAVCINMYITFTEYTINATRTQIRRPVEYSTRVLGYVLLCQVLCTVPAV